MARQAAQADHCAGQRAHPIYLAAVGPKNLELAGELADGWLAIFYAPSSRQSSWPRCGPAGPGRQDPRRLRRRAQRPAGGGRGPSRVCRSGPRVRGPLSRRHGQPGAELLQRARGPDGLRRGRGHGAGPVLEPERHRDAMAAVPFEFIDQTSLLGDRDRIADRLQVLAPPG